MALGATIAADVYRRYGFDLQISSGSEPETLHKGKPVVGGTQDPHYEGKALDISIKELKPENRPLLVKSLQDALGAEFVVLWESQGTSNEHAHLQYGHVA